MLPLLRRPNEALVESVASLVVEGLESDSEDDSGTQESNGDDDWDSDDDCDPDMDSQPPDDWDYVQDGASSRSATPDEFDDDFQFLREQYVPAAKMSDPLLLGPPKRPVSDPYSPASASNSECPPPKRGKPPTTWSKKHAQGGTPWPPPMLTEYVACPSLLLFLIEPCLPHKASKK